MHLIALYLQHPLDGMAQLSTSGPVEDSIKKLIILIGELVMMLKNDNRNNNNNSRPTIIENKRAGVLEAEGTSIFKLKNASCEGESAFNSKIPSSDSIFEVFTAKRRKKNNGRVEEVETPEVAPNIRKEITRIMRAGRVVTTKMAEYCLKVNKEENAISIYCKAQVKDHFILLKAKTTIRKVDKFPVTIGGKMISSRTVVTDTRNYGIIIRND
ncbi:6495_t:CDS:2 [Gigaspora margarita]|uniref:6495_t:CDS:1 n=1 Tax=Gigaspora margarita TaxID=4874 RepID=A0ABN7V7T5_GIGMA|nr:6495_t:CDS:2 [Gigaspora margarita]